MAKKTTTKRKTATKKKPAAKKKPATKKKATAKKKTATKKKPTAKKKTSVKRKTAAKGKATAAMRPAFVAGPGCPVSRSDFTRGAQRLQIQISSAGERAREFELDPREFSSGSFGWFASEKLDVPVGKKLVRCQLSLNVTVIGSKDSK